MTGWREVADGVLHRRYDPLDVGVCVVRGSDGLLVVDTRGSGRQGAALRDDLRALGGPVAAVVNTHAHFDHTFGNQCFGPGSALDVPIHAHAGLPAHLDAYERPALARWVADGEEPVDEWRGVVVTPPTRLVQAEATLGLGDRDVLLAYFGRGHTDHDLVVRVPDAGAWLVGDLLEESGPPVYDPDAFPLDWPGTVARLRASVADDDVLVPGHGAPVTPAFAATQHAGLQEVADLVRALHAAGVPAADALHEGGDRWPFPPDGLTAAVAEGYRALDAVSPPSPGSSAAPPGAAAPGTWRSPPAG